MSERLIGNARIYKVDKSRCETDLDEIEVRLVYLPNCSAGRGFYAQITPQKREHCGGYDVTTFDFWSVKVHTVLRNIPKYSKKAEKAALETFVEMEPYWVANMASALDLVLEHDPIHGNW